MKTLVVAALAAGLGFSVVSGAGAKVSACGALGADAVEVGRNMRACLASNVACAAVNGLQVFGNAEGRLPKAGANQAYYEGRVGVDRQGAGGVRRLVMLFQGAQGRGTVFNQYYTADHYVTFCETNGK